MIDDHKLKKDSSCSVFFKDIPDGILVGATYVENDYNKRMNRYLRRWRWWLQRFVFKKYENGYTDLTYLPYVSKKKQRKLLQRKYPFLSNEILSRIPTLKTTDILNYLEDIDDARYLKPGFLFFHKEIGNGITEYDYYPLTAIDDRYSSLKKSIIGILRWHKRIVDERCLTENKRTKIGGGGVHCSRCAEDEDYADNMFEALDVQTKSKLSLFKKQVEELQRCGVPMNLLESILHRSILLSKLVITKKFDIVLPDYNNMVIKMEPLVKAVFFLFLKHPEGIIFKELPDYREELIEIYKKLRPLGLNERALKSIEDVTDPFNNSINEKCARIREAFNKKIDDEITRYYAITGKRGEPKKIALPRELVVWEE